MQYNTNNNYNTIIKLKSINYKIVTTHYNNRSRIYKIVITYYNNKLII